MTIHILNTNDVQKNNHQNTLGAGITGQKYEHKLIFITFPQCFLFDMQYSHNKTEYNYFKFE